MGRLHDRMAEDLTLRNFSPYGQKTEPIWIFWLQLHLRYAAIARFSPWTTLDPESMRGCLRSDSSAPKVRRLNYASFSPDFGL